MRKLILVCLVNILAFYLASLLFVNIWVTGFGAYVGAGIVLGLVNLAVRPILFLLTLPFTILTLGLFSLVVNTWMVMLTAKLIPGMHIYGFWTALGTSIVISLINGLFKGIYKNK
ncbi:MAG TPA: phage holin family protein [Candidatus Deferrimicrobium sp.]|nr:phage holin family protein [Candidatus Deferrimicrobium sp.]